MTFLSVERKLLAEQTHLACEGNDVIATTARGYQLSPKLNVQVTTPRKRDSGKSLPERSDADERKQWLLDQLRRGKKLRRRDYEEHFGISTPTAKRDFGELGGAIEFTGIGEAGLYRLKAPSPHTRTTV